MKTILDLPDQVFREAKALAASQGITLKAFFSEALGEKLQRCSAQTSTKKPWMTGFGDLAHLSDETKRIMQDIEEEFGQTEPEEL